MWQQKHIETETHTLPYKQNILRMLQIISDPWCQEAEVLNENIWCHFYRILIAKLNIYVFLSSKTFIMYIYMNPLIIRVFLQGDGVLSVCHQSIAWTWADILSFEHLGRNFRDLLFEIQFFLSGKCILKCHLQNTIIYINVSVFVNPSGVEIAMWRDK